MTLQQYMFAKNDCKNPAYEHPICRVFRDVVEPVMKHLPDHAAMWALYRDPARDKESAVVLKGAGDVATALIVLSLSIAGYYSAEPETPLKTVHNRAIQWFMASLQAACQIAGLPAVVAAVDAVKPDVVPPGTTRH